MAKRLYVGGLPYSTTNEDLANLFAAVGTVVSANIVTDKFTGQAKGFGFVEMSSDSEADQAISSVNGTMMGGRTLTVNEARPREDRPRMGSPAGSNRGGGGYGGNHERDGSRGGYGGGRDRDNNRGGGGNRW